MFCVFIFGILNVGYILLKVNRHGFSYFIKLIFVNFLDEEDYLTSSFDAAHRDEEEEII